MKAGLIVNPSSGKNSGKGLKLAAALGDAIPVKVLGQFSELEGALRDMAAQGVDMLAISSGDGTIQAIQTMLAESRIFPKLPELMLIPHGTTNMTAADLGVKTRNIARLALFLQSGPALLAAERRARPTLRIANPGDGRVRHGMFTGTGAIWKAVQYCQTAVHGTGLKGEAATFATLAISVAGLLFNRDTPEDERIARAWPITAHADGKPMGQGGKLLFLATTLDKLVLGSRPFWGGKRGPIRASVLPFPIGSLWRWLIPALYGSENRNMPPGAESVSGMRFEVQTETDWIVDGEFFPAPEQGPLIITAGVEFTYLVV